MTKRRGEDVLAHVMTRVVKDHSGCWNSLWCMTPKGYSTITLDRQVKRVHRLVYEMSVGPIPEGLTLDHLCRNKRCCNPAHLEPVTAAENLRRAIAIGAVGGSLPRDRCPAGHAYSENDRRPHGARVCRRCESDRRKERIRSDPAYRAKIAERNRAYYQSKSVATN